MTSAEASPRQYSGLAFLLNVNSIQDNAEIELTSGYLIRKATDSEVAIIRKTIEQLNTAPFTKPAFHWEHEWPVINNQIKKLDSKNYRYHVISFNDNGNRISDIERVFLTLQNEPIIGFKLLVVDRRIDDPSVGWDQAKLFNYFEQCQFETISFLDISPKDIAIFRRLYQKIQNTHESEIDIGFALDRMRRLYWISDDIQMKFVGYFSILESIITHQPRLEDTIDSIGRQIKTKSALLNRLFDEPIDYGMFFPGQIVCNKNIQLVWKALYTYRNIIAHGNRPNFAEKELRILKGPKEALTVIRDATKAVIRKVIDDPEFMADLQRC